MRELVATSWMSDAACRSYEIDYWFSDDRSVDKVREAKKVCAKCKVRVECLTYALRNEDYGVWGGLTPRERRRYQRGLPVENSRRKPL